MILKNIIVLPKKEKKIFILLGLIYFFITLFHIDYL